MTKVFVDGLSGTTGLVIMDRLKAYDNIEILKIDEEKKKDPIEKKKFLNDADIVFLCLPDDAAKESALLVDNDNTVIIDASTAHRTQADWAYGIPELSKKHRETIQSSKRIANPGCHASAFALLVYPLIKEGLLSEEIQLSAHSLTGYSGGGKAMISKYEDTNEYNPYHRGPRHYALGLNHKHVPEMMFQCGLKNAPNFMPIVGNFYKGLVATIQLNLSNFTRKMIGAELQDFYNHYYENSYFVRVNPYGLDEGLFDHAFDVSACNDTNFADIFVYANETSDVVSIMCRLDNLGKGASGAALQNMNIVLGLDEWYNLV